MIIEEIFKAYEHMQEHHRQKEPGEVYVTDLLHCVLRPRQKELATTLIRGTAIHEGIEKLLKEHGETQIEFEKEVKKKYDDFTLIGRLDGITKNGIVIEFKTVYKPPEHPYEQHIYQVLIYMNMTGSEKGIILYIGNNEMREFLIEKDKIMEIGTGQVFFSQYHVDDEWIKEQIKKYVNNKLVATFNECQFCEIKKTCQFSKVR